MSDDKNKVSILLPVRNEEHYISECLDSIFSQDYADTEVVVSDNCSTDATVEVVKRYQHKGYRLSLITNEQPINPLENMRVCLRHATGRYVTFIGGDDYYDSGYISNAMEMLQEFGARSVITRVFYFDDRSRNILAELPPDEFERLSSGMEVTHFLRFYIARINHDELVLGIVERELFEKAMSLKFPSSEASGWWISAFFLSEALYTAQRVPYQKNSRLYKRYNKEYAHNSYQDDEQQYRGYYNVRWNSVCNSFTLAREFAKHSVRESVSGLFMLLLFPRRHTTGHWNYPPLLTLVLGPVYLVMRRLKGQVSRSAPS